MNLNNVFNLESVNVNFIKPFCVKLGVNDRIIDFQVDTGSAVSVMSKKDFVKFKLGCVDKVERTDVNLKAYNGSIIVSVGIFKVKIKYKDHFESLSLYIVIYGGPPIVGKDWLVKLEILPLYLGLHSLTHQSAVQNYPLVFSEKLG